MNRTGVSILVVLIFGILIGNINASYDNIPPSSITGLKNISYKPTYINWTWVDPKDTDFTKVMIYVNGKFKTNVTRDIKYYNSTGLIPNVLYEIGTHTVDTSGNINLTWVNKTAKTAPTLVNKIIIKGEVSQLIATENFSIKTWDGRNFAGFWYDIDQNKGTEILSIIKFDGNMSISRDSLEYRTYRSAQKYKAFDAKGLTIENALGTDLRKPTAPARGGYYAIVGWMGEKYVGVNGMNHKLSRLILEQGITDKKTLKVKESWNLGDGYKLIIQSIDTHSAPNQSWIILSKNGIKLDDKIIAQNEIYTYSTDIAEETNVPIFVTYAENITSDKIQFKYTWLISTNMTEIKSGDTFGIFQVDTEEPLILTNYGSIPLYRGSTITLSDNMKFKVADSEYNDVRFYPFIEITNPGIHEVRGSVSQLISKTNFTIKKWDGINFAGVFYDIDDNKATEVLNILKFKDNRIIDKDNLTYAAFRSAKKYNVFKDKGANYTIENGLDYNLIKMARAGYYAIVGWMGEKYVGVNGKNNKISKLILEQGSKDKKTLRVGEKWNLGEGYTLTVQSIDTRSTPKQARIILDKDGNKIKDKIIAQGDVTTISLDSMAGEYNVPIFVTYLESVFDDDIDIVQLKYTWLISNNVTILKTDDRFGVFKVGTEQPLSLRNYVPVYLTRDSTVNLTEKMKFIVADSDDNDVRFYPKIDYQIQR